MIIFAELQMQGDKHVHVNSGLLNIVKTSFDKQEVFVFCDNIHKDKLLKYVVYSELLRFSTFVYTGVKELKKRSSLSKTLRESFLAYKIFRTAKKNKAELIVFASAFPFTALSLNLFSKIFKQRIIVCLHGDLGVLSLKRNKPTTVIFRSAIKCFFKYRGLKTIVLFYGKSIEEGLFKMFLDYKKKNVISIDHPYNYDRQSNYDEPSLDNKVTVANIGTGLMNKNSQLLYRLTELQKNNIINNKIKFIQIGNVSKEVLSYSNKYVEILNNNEFIPFEIFEENIKKADYFIYFFTNNSVYDLCPSGTFFDAIKYRKPIISLHNPFFDYYFKKLGNIGYLCDSIEEMDQIINSILEGKDNAYAEQINALTSATALLSIDKIQNSFLEQYSKIN